MTATPLDLLHAAEAAIAAGTRDPEAYNRVAWARVQQGDTEAGFGLLHTALRIAPDDPATLTSLGMLLHRAGHLRDAILHCDAALASDPQYVDAWVERGQIFTSGASTHHNFCAPVMPRPSAASPSAGSSPARPVTPLRRIGSTAYSASASSDGRNPSAGMPPPTSADSHSRIG